MIKRERATVPRTELRVAGAVCDACGTELRHASGFGIADEWPFHGVFIRGQLLPDDHNAANIQYIEVELCGECVIDIVLTKANGAHLGKGHRDLVLNLPERNPDE